MKTEICRQGGFHRVVTLQPMLAVPGQFVLEFASVLDSARDPLGVQCNFSAVLCQADVLALRDLFDSMLQA